MSRVIEQALVDFLDETERERLAARPLAVLAWRLVAAETGSREEG